MKKIGLKLLFPLLFVLLSCSRNKPKTVIIDGKEYVAMSIPEDKTKDVDFITKKGLTIKDRLSRYLEIYGAEFFIEPGTCVFLKLEDDWRACIAMADMTLNLDETILYFYKVDPSYSRSMTLKEWNEFIDPRYSRDDSEF